MALESKPASKHTEGSLGASQLGGELPFWSPGASGDRSGKSESSSHPVLGSSPLVPSLIFVVLLVLLISSVEFRYLVSPAGDIPSPREALALVRNHGSPLPQDDVKVWTKKQFGYYYCQGDLMFGRTPGRMMAQTEALLSGYRPVRKEYCTSIKPKKESRRSGPSRKLVEVR
jgi:hypothetical protein